jgi:hypothetical protein
MRFVVRLLIFTLYVNDLAAFGPVVRSETLVEAAAIARKPQIALPRVKPPRAAMATSTTAPAIAPTTAPTTETTLTSGGGSGIGLGSGASASVFGPKRYTRTTDAPNKFTESITTPDWVRWPYVVRIKNGESNGSNRVSSAVVLLNGLPVASPLDFNQHVDTVDRPVLLPILTHHLTLYVEVRGEPGSYITITLLGTSGDTRAPTITITDPPADTTTSNNTPHLAVTYADADASDCVASGLDTSTLRVTVDGVDRTSLFTLTNTGADATIPTSLALADGSHVMHAEIKDRAGNIGTADRTFNVRNASQPPTLTITAPAEGALVGASPLTVSGTVASHASGTVSVQCGVGTATVPAQVSATTWSCAVPLAEGDNAIVVTATDAGGSAHVTRRVTFDATAPALSITSPLDGSYTAASSVTVSGTVSDAHGVTVTVNGTPATITGAQFEATVPVGSGPESVIQVVAQDAAGNQATVSVTLHVAQGPLTVQITSPAANAVVRGPMIDVSGTTNQDLHVDVDVNGETASVLNGQFTAKVPVLEGTQTLRATARDAAGRTATTDVTVRIDTIAPAITLAEPAAGVITNAATVRVSGSVTDTSAFTLQLDGRDVPIANGQFSVDAPLTSEGPITLTLVATDIAGNSSTKTIDLIVDRTAPAIDIVSPTPSALMSGLPIVVQGNVTDATTVAVTVDGTPATRTSETWQASFDTLPDGAHTFTVTATDAAGNVATKTVTATLDTQPPVLTITSPAPGTLTRFDVIDVSGTVQDISAVTVTIGDRTATVTNGTFTATGVLLPADGDIAIVVKATDGTGRMSERSIVVTRDSIAPQLELTTPERITRRQPGQAVATVTDANGVSQVVFAVNGVLAGTLTAPPFTIPLTAPDGVAIGGTFTVTVTATDRAGNLATVPPRGVRVAADGAIVGQVLSDATGLPIEGATVRVGTDVRTTDAQGRYTLPTEQSSIPLTVERDGMTTVSRVVSMSSGVGTVPVDARLTPLATAVNIGADGGTLSTASSSVSSGGTGSDSSTSSTSSASANAEPVVTVVVPAGVVAAGTPFQLTSLTAQGLPELLPLGWSPLAAFDVRSAATVPGTFDANVTFTSAQLPAAGSAIALVQYRPLQHAWVVIARDLAASNAGLVAATLPGLGVFAFVSPDAQDPPLAVPAIGEALTGVEVIELPITATSRGLVDPAVIPPTGGTARGQLRVDSPTAVPSGTLVQAEITETFTLPSGQTASEELRREDIVLYRAPVRDVSTSSSGSGSTSGGSGSTSGGSTATSANAVSAAFPITPSRTFDPADLLEGHVHLDILAGRESVRGTTGGREAVTVTADDGKLVMPAEALDDDTAVRLTHEAFSSFLPTHPALTPLGEFVVDVQGRMKLPAELSMSATTAGAGGAGTGATFVIARVERIDGVPLLSVVALATLQGDRLVATAAPGLTGVNQGGRYVFYRVTGDIGFVSGTTRAGGQGQPVAAVLSADTLPFIARSGVDGDGRYTLATLAGAAAVTVTARVPRTSLLTQGTATVPAAGAIATLDLTLAATVTTASVTPVDGARGVAKATQITITTTTPINATSVSADAAHLVKLLDAQGTQTVNIPVRVVLAGSRQTLSIVPSATLEAGATYRLDVSGLIDTYGGLIAVPQTTFQTAAETAPTYSPESLTFSFPDTAGVVTVSAPPGSFPLGAQFLIINSVSGEVLSLSVQNDGSVTGTLRATLNDRLVITITDPDGHVTMVTRSQFEDPATGRTAIGPGGGEVKGPGGIALRVPEGAVSSAITLKITPVAEDQFPTKPDVPSGHFGGGLRIEASAPTQFAKEVDVVFPLPADVVAATQAAGKLPKDAFFYIYRRSTADEGQPLFETVDYANVEGTDANAKVVTASFPFSGLIAIESLEASYAILMWTFNQALPGEPTEGVITGQVLRPVYESGATTPTYVGVPGARVELVDPTDTRFDPHTGAMTAANGRYTIFDQRFVGGPVRVQTTVDGETAHATVFAVERSDTKLLEDPALSTLVAKGVFKQIATANLTLSPAQAAPPAPALTMRVMRTMDGHRVDTRGLVVSGTPLVIGIDAGDATVTAATINGNSYAVQSDPAAQVTPRDPLAMRFIIADTFTPTQPGSYTVTATALPAFGAAVTSTMTFRVLAAGGGIDTDTNAPPSVITAQTVPKANATGVPVTIFPQIAFTEPVLHIPGNVKLLDASNLEVPIRISGVGVDATGQPVVIDDVTSAATVVTSLTIQPRLGLAYGASYRLVLTDAIVDRDLAADGVTPAPKSLVPYESSFTTFNPEAIGGTDAQFASPGLVVLGDRAYVLETQYAGGVGGVQAGKLHVFDVSDPVQPQEVGTPTDIGAAPRDIAGENHTVVVATMSHTMFAPGLTTTNTDIASGPSNLLVYDVSGPTPQWIGAASLTDNIVDGTLNRVVMKDQVAYVATARKGIQVVDLTQTDLGDLATAATWEQSRRLYAPGEGVNRQAVVATIPISDPANPGNTASVWLNDLKVGDYVIDGTSQRLVFTTGRPQAVGLVIVNPVTQQVIWQSALQDANGALVDGQAVALAHIADRDLAIVGGYGTVGNAGAAGVVTIVDLSPLSATPHGAPQVIAWVPLAHGVVDILIKDSAAIVTAPTTGGLASDGLATFIGLADPFHPQSAGTLTGVGSRMSQSLDGVLLSTNRTFVTGNTSGLDGLRTLAMDRIAYFARNEPQPIAVRNGHSLEPIDLTIGVVPSDYEISTQEVEVSANDTVVATLPTTTGAVTIPSGFAFNVDVRYSAQIIINRGMGESELRSRRTALRPAEVEFIGTVEVDTQSTSGSQTKQDVAKVFDARPSVSIDTLQVTTLTLPSTFPWGGENPVGYALTIRGTVRDVIAPIDAVWINGRRVSVTAASAGSDGLGPFVGTFALQSTDTNALAGMEDQLVTVTATNALGNMGADGAWVRTNPDASGDIGDRTSISHLESVPSVDSVDTSRGEHVFQIEVKDPGLNQDVAWATLKAGSQSHAIRLSRQGTAFRSRPLYLVPESFHVPASVTGTEAELLRATRIPVSIGDIPSIVYVRDSIHDEAIAAGVLVVDAQDQPIKFVPAIVQRPIVTITDLSNFDTTNHTGVVEGDVSDPVAASVSSTLTPKVTANGLELSVTSLGAGQFHFSGAVVLPTPDTHVQVRAENVTGAWGIDDRMVTTAEGADPTVDDPEEPADVIVTPQPPAPFRILAVGPRLSPDDITAQVSGLESIPFSNPELRTETPPAVPLTFEEYKAKGNGVYIYRSTTPVLAAKIPSHAWRIPSTPRTLGQAPVVAVEVGGLVQAAVHFGTIGDLTGQAEVSGFELVSPVDGAVVNVSKRIQANGPIAAVTVRWHGVAAQNTALALIQPSMTVPGTASYAASVPLTEQSSDSLTVSLATRSGLDEIVLHGSATDTAGHQFDTEAGILAFTTSTAANQTPLSAETFRDPGALQLQPGRYLLPSVIDGLDLAYNAASDAEISDHLQKNGLRPLAIKRNGGTVVTVVRNDGHDALAEGLAFEVPNGFAVPGAPPHPLLDEIVDGDDLRYRDIVDVGRDGEFQNTYLLPSGGINERSIIIQKVRAELGLPPSEGGRSAEYRRAVDAAKKDLGLNVLQAAVDALSGPAAPAVAGVFFLRAGGSIAIVDETGQVLEHVVVASDILAPKQLTKLDNYLLKTGPETHSLVDTYRGLQSQFEQTLLDSQKAKISNDMGNVSAELGLLASRRFAEERLGLTADMRICCDGAIAGGGATGKFDEVYLSGDRVIIIEAKGGQSYRNPLGSNAGGRKVIVNGIEKYALQGSEQYLRSVLAQMGTSSDPHVLEAAEEIAARLTDPSKIDYYFTSAKWRGARWRKTGRGLVKDVSPVVRAYKVVW